MLANLKDLSSIPCAHRLLPNASFWSNCCIGFEPGKAGWEAQTIPLYYFVTQNKFNLFSFLETLFRNKSQLKFLKVSDHKKLFSLVGSFGGLNFFLLNSDEVSRVSRNYPTSLSMNGGSSSSSRILFRLKSNMNIYLDWLTTGIQHFWWLVQERGHSQLIFKRFR